jgi:hypothetical protein
MSPLESNKSRPPQEKKEKLRPLPQTTTHPDLKLTAVVTSIAVRPVIRKRRGPGEAAGAEAEVGGKAGSTELCAGLGDGFWVVLEVFSFVGLVEGREMKGREGE